MKKTHKLFLIILFILIIFGLVFGYLKKQKKDIGVDKDGNLISNSDNNYIYCKDVFGEKVNYSGVEIDTRNIKVKGKKEEASGLCKQEFNLIIKKNDKRE